MSSSLAASDLVTLFRKELERCALKPDESVVILSEPNSRDDYVAATFAAAQSLGVRSVVSAVLPGGSPVTAPGIRSGSGFGLAALEGFASMLDFLKSVDMVVDLTIEGHIHAEMQQGILRAGTRILFVCDPPEILARNMTGPEDKARALAAVDMLNAAKTMHVTSEYGTDLVVDISECHPGFQTGFADDPGRWDHWPSCMVVCWPTRADGQFVLATGDILFPFKEYVTQPITISVEDNHIMKVEGSGDQAFMVQQYCDGRNDASAPFTSHMGWGLLPTADWLSLGMYDRETQIGMDGRSYEGNFLISTGPHPFKNRITPFHLDLPMRDCSIALDNTYVVDRGRVVA
jgi:2,5-dihydroxypyridine 5,6-dioxygenase